MFTIAGHVRERLRFPERLTFLVLGSFFLFTPCAWAGSYTLTSQTGGTYDFADQGSGPYSNDPYGSGYGAESPGTLFDAAATCTGTITTVYTWNNGGNPNDLPPQEVVVQQYCNAMWNSNDFSNPVTGSASDGLGDAEQGSSGGNSSSGYYGYGQSTGTHYTVQSGGNTVTVTCSPSATASTAFTPYVIVRYKVQILPVIITPTSTKLYNDSLYLLTGQQVQAKLSGIPSGSTYPILYDWSAGGDTFETYDPTRSSGQLVALTDTDKGASQFNFYDKSQESITITCTASFTAPDNSFLTITATTPSISVEKPSITASSIDTGNVYHRTVENEYGLFPAQGTGNPGGAYWHNITVSVPAPFSGGTSCFTQIVTPDHEFNGTPLGTGNNTPGLDNTFEYSNYTWTVTSIGSNSDSPAIAINGDGSNAGDKVTANDTLQNWIMYQPTGGIWVPLATYTYTWSVTVTWMVIDGIAQWQVTSASPPPPNPGPTYTYNNTNTPPQWSMVHTN